MGFSLGGAITLSTALDDNRKTGWATRKDSPHMRVLPVAKAFIPKIESGGALTGLQLSSFTARMTPTATETKCRN